MEERGAMARTDGVTPAAPAPRMEEATRTARCSRWIPGVVGLTTAVIYPLPFQASGVAYLQTVGFLVLLYASLGIAWNIVGGWCGQFDFGPMVFFGTGAYIAAAGVKFLGWSPWLGMLVAIPGTALFCAVVTYPITKLRGHYFAIATVAIWLIVLPVATNWELIGGSQGMFIPLLRPANFLAEVVSLQPGSRVKEIVFYYVALLFFLLAFFFARAVERSKLGYYFRAIRDDQEGAESLGIDSRAYKVMARCLMASVYAVGGGIFAIWALSVFPEQVLDFNWGVLPTIAVVLGGIGQIWGPVIGSLILIPLSQLMSTYFGTGPLAGRGVDLIVYGILIMIIAAARPLGLLSLPWRRWWRRAVGVTK
jgi:branched-chain amino acid transport system permease protein